MSGEYTIPARRERVWAALNDPEILKQAIPGCDELIKHSDTELEAKVTAKVGPVKAKFSGNVRLENIQAPASYSIVGEGKGGAAGFAKGGADVALEEAGEETILRYTAKAEVGGKLAQIGSRLIQGTSKKMADQFFGDFSRIVASAAEKQPEAPAEPETDATKSAEPVASAEAAAEPTAEPVPEKPIAQPAAEAPVAQPDEPASEPQAPEPVPETPVAQAAAEPPRPAPARATAATPATTPEPAGNKLLWIAAAIVVVIVLYLIMGG